ncbi:hypothetical protein PoB_006404800, partial [Plakobranchus ocellatus]
GVVDTSSLKGELGFMRHKQGFRKDDSSLSHADDFSTSIAQIPSGAPPPAPWPDGGPKSPRSAFCSGLAIYKNQTNPSGQLERKGSSGRKS